MKNLIIISAMLFGMLTINACGNRSSAPQQQESTVHSEFTVAGNCGMCKTRIENAAKEAGSESANWDLEHQVLHVEFDESKTSLEKIQKKLAAVGHDNENFRADDDDYDNLHSCCKYERLN